MHGKITVKDATLDSYRAGGRSSAEALIDQMQGNQGIEKYLAANDRDAFNNALASAFAEMVEGGATEEKLDAWSEGFAQVMDAYTDRVNSGRIIDDAIIRTRPQ